MNWLRKWYYLVLLFCTGIVYLVCADGWQVYARPVAAVCGWCEALTAQAGNGAGENGGTGMEWPEDGGDVPGAEIAENIASSVQTGVDEEADGALRPEPGSDADKGRQPGDAAAGDSIQQTGEEGEEEDAAPDRTSEATVTYRTVEDDYFADAVFIGDSRTVGMYEYGGLEEISTFYASKGLSVYKLFTSEIVAVEGQKKKITVEEALQENSFSKIYLMIGINEMGTGTVDTFIEKYTEVVQQLQQLQPDAIIYLQGIMKVTTERSEKGDYITNEGIVERNGRIEQLADNDKIFYLDVNPLICDETGGMVESYTFDGVHLKAKYIEIWKQYLKEHAADVS